MYKRKKISEDALVSVKAYVDEMAHREKLMPFDICRLLGIVISIYHSGWYSNSNLTLSTLENKGVRLRVIKGKPVYEIKAAWTFNNMQVSDVMVDGLDNYLEGIQLIKLATKDSSHKLKLKVTIDLDKWPEVRVNLLHFQLKMLSEITSEFEEVRKRYQTDTALLLEHFFPNVNIEAMLLAVDLGMISEEQYDFKQWFEDLLQNPVTASVPLPCDLSQ